MKRALPAFVATLGLLFAACGGDAGGTTTTSSTSSTSSTTTTTTLGTTTSTAPPATTTTVQATTTTIAPESTTTTLAGEPIDFGPARGDVLIVIGVRHDDVLNLRDGPGTSQPILEGIPPTFSELEAQGSTRELPSSFWIEVEYEGTVGWVSLAFVGYEGDTTDDTARIVSELGETPVEASMTDLGELVAAQYASQDEPESNIVQVTPVISGDLAEVSYDVIGLGDDAVRGVRVHVFGQQTADGFGLKSVEVTAICGRGVDDSGACV